MGGLLDNLFNMPDSSQLDFSPKGKIHSPLDTEKEKEEEREEKKRKKKNPSLAFAPM